jgi:hypothetical protein
MARDEALPQREAPLFFLKNCDDDDDDREVGGMKDLAGETEVLGENLP